MGAYTAEIDFSGKQLVIIGNNAVLDAGGKGRFFQTGAPALAPPFGQSASTSLELHNVTLKSGQGKSGGAIYVSSAALALFDTTFSTNKAGSGGAIFAAAGADVQIHSSSLLANEAAVGGAIYAVSATLALFTTTFTTNFAGVNTGGALYALSSKVTLQECAFTRGAKTTAGKDDIERNGGEVAFVCPNGTTGARFVMPGLELNTSQLPPSKAVVICTPSSCSSDCCDVAQCKASYSSSCAAQCCKASLYTPKLCSACLSADPNCTAPKPTPSPRPSPRPQPGPSPHHGSNAGKVAGAVIGSLFLVALIAALAVLLVMKRRDANMWVLPTLQWPWAKGGGNGGSGGSDALLSKDDLDSKESGTAAGEGGGTAAAAVAVAAAAVAAACCFCCVAGTADGDDGEGELPKFCGYTGEPLNDAARKVREEDEGEDGKEDGKEDEGGGGKGALDGDMNQDIVWLTNKATGKRYAVDADGELRDEEDHTQDEEEAPGTTESDREEKEQHSRSKRGGGRRPVVRQ
jgi:predicted outer membrane repeat protein